MLRRFFPYYGSKLTLAPRYGPPKYNRVIEPFGGAAGYSCYWEPAQVILIEINPVVYGVCKYIQRVSPAEILRLPTNVSHVDELPPWICEEARNLIGFYFNCGLAAPGLSRSNWAQNPNKQGSYWSETTKYRIASQLNRIRHWNIIWGSYEEAPHIEAHWFIDPPYNNAAGRHYPCHDIDYAALEEWCKSRRGFVQVCENDGATWLPFRPLTILSTHRPRGYSVEALCEIDNRPSRRSK
jgi:hypothetical protein